jgi:hypothetical protein
MFAYISTFIGGIASLVMALCSILLLVHIPSKRQEFQKNICLIIVQLSVAGMFFLYFLFHFSVPFVLSFCIILNSMIAIPLCIATANELKSIHT